MFTYVRRLPLLRKLTLFPLVLLIVGAIDSIRNLPAAALFGSELIFFFLFAALVFLIPAALISAELASALPRHAGIYHWVRVAFGEKLAMLAIWLQWINTMIWYPTILAFIAGTFAYLIDPQLAAKPWYLISMIVGVFWLLTLLNLWGIEVSAKINNYCSLIGMVFPMVFLILLGVFWVISGDPIQITFSKHSLLPIFTKPASWISLIAIISSFLGIELSSVHVNEIEKPQRNFPKAIAIATPFILFSMLLGSLSIAIVLPMHDIRLVDGVMQVFTSFFEKFHMAPLTPVLALLIVIGSFGSMINWLISPSKGLLQAAELGYLPTFFCKKNQHGVAINILLTQAVVVSLVCLVFLLLPSVNSFYWFLTDLSTELYLLMYLLMFFAALRLHYTHQDRKGAFKIPGRTAGIWTVALLGIFGCLVTIGVGFVAPEHLDVGGAARYALLILCGAVLMVSPVFLFYWYKKRSE